MELFSKLLKSFFFIQDFILAIILLHTDVAGASQVSHLHIISMLTGHRNQIDHASLRLALGHYTSFNKEYNYLGQHLRLI